MWTDEDKEKMENAAREAGLKLQPLLVQYPEASKAFGEWIKENKPSAGAKRLCRILEELV